MSVINTELQIDDSFNCFSYKYFRNNLNYVTEEIEDPKK